MVRRYWWVNQTTGYDREIEIGRLWTCRNEHGTLIAGRAGILSLAPGDLLFHYNRGRIRAVSEVMVGAAETPRPEQYPAKRPAEPDVGWAVFVKVLRADLSVPGATISKFLTYPTEALDRLGLPKRRYLAQLSQQDAETLADLAHAVLPSEPSISGRPMSEVAEMPGPTDLQTLVQRRTEQAALRHHLLGTDQEGVCALCGNVLPAPLLVAAHIKPRRDCSDEERRDFDNVAMLLCALGCDALFEWGYVVVDPNGIIQATSLVAGPVLARRAQELTGRHCAKFGPQTSAHFAARASQGSLG